MAIKFIRKIKNNSSVLTVKLIIRAIKNSTDKEYFKKWLFMICLSVIISTCIGLTIPILFKNVLYYLSSINDNQYSTLMIIFGYGISYTFGQSMVSVREIIFSKVLRNSTKYIVGEAFDNLMKIPLNQHKNKNIAGTIRMLIRVGESMTHVVMIIMPYIIPIVLDMLLIPIIITKTYNSTIGTVVLITLFIFFYTSWYMTIKYVLPSYREMIDSDTENSGVILDCLHNLQTIKTFSMERDQSIRLMKMLTKWEELGKTYDKKMLTMLLIQKIIMGIGITVTTFMIGYYVTKGVMHPADLVLINGYMSQMSGPMTWFGLMFRDFSRTIDHLSNINNVLISYSDNEASLPDIEMQYGSISFEDVSFGYVENNDVLKNINLKINHSERIAIIGSNSSGKSTIATLLNKIYEHKSGIIKIDNIDIKKWSQKSIRSKLIVVPQNTAILTDTVSANIVFGADDVGINNMIEAAKVVNLHEKIMRMKDGYNTILNTKDVYFSNGEQQLISIARAIVRNPKVIVFDETFDGLDINTQQLVCNNIYETMYDTTIIFTSKLVPLVYVDRLYIIENGKIREYDKKN